jgi:hypothetical protein
VITAGLMFAGLAAAGIVGFVIGCPGIGAALVQGTFPAVAIVLVALGLLTP